MIELSHFQSGLTFKTFGGHLIRFSRMEGENVVCSVLGPAYMSSMEKPPLVAVDQIKLNKQLRSKPNAVCDYDVTYDAISGNLHLPQRLESVESVLEYARAGARLVLANGWFARYRRPVDGGHLIEIAQPSPYNQFELTRVATIYSSTLEHPQSQHLNVIAYYGHKGGIK